MKRLRKYAYSLFMGLTVVVLIGLSRKYNDASNTVVAEVQSEKFAISYHRPVKIKKIFVFPGQDVKAGDKILEVERPDLMLDAERRQSNIDRLESQLSSLLANKSNTLSILEIEKEQKLLKLKTDASQLELLLANRNRTGTRLMELNLISDSITYSNPALLQLKKDHILLERNNIIENHKLLVTKTNHGFRADTSEINSQLQLLRKELKELEMEHSDLIKYAHLDGTVGNVYREVEEIIPPYTTIVSLYVKNPTLIRALMNEKNKFSLSPGMQVKVESTNRPFQANGIVKEIGNRMIEFPRRLNTNKEFPVWGREVFIEIKEQSKFLNGEKVFVIEKISN